MIQETRVIREIPGFYTVQPLGVLRRTPGVCFDFIPMDLLGKVDAIDRVIHSTGAVSPGPVGQIERPWYMHTCQVDHLIVLHGRRTVDIYHTAHELHRFDVTPDAIHLDGKLLYDGPAMLTWHRNVFHRVKSDDRIGSASLNFATRYEGFDLDTNFSIYSLDVDTGTYEVLRAGHLDQPERPYGTPIVEGK